MSFLFDTSLWPPRWNCGKWSELLGYTNIISEFMIWGAYMAIPIILIYFIRKRKDIPFHRVFILFALFIFFCGFTHFIEGLIFYYPIYRFLTVLLVCTAAVSWLTAFALIPVLPRVLSLPSLANVNEMLKKDLRQINQRLEVAIETLQAGVWDWDLKSDQIHISDTLIQILELPFKKNEVSSEDFLNFVYFEDKDRFVNTIKDNLNNPAAQGMRVKMLIKENHIFYVGLSWKVIQDNETPSTRVIGTLIKQG